MTQRISEADWKLFRGIHADALSRYHARALAEIHSVLKGHGKTDAERFTTLARMIYLQNREASRLFNDLRRSTAILQLACLKAAGLVTDEEFARFGSEVRSVIELFPATESQSFPKDDEAAEKDAELGAALDLRKAGGK